MYTSTGCFPCAARFIICGKLFDKIDSVQGVPHRAVASVCGITGAIVLWGVKLGFVP